MNRIWDLTAFEDRTALLDENGGSTTYGQLQAEGAELVKAIGTRCLAFILCRNSIGSVLGYTAFLNHGIVPVMLNSHLDNGLLSRLLEAYAPEYLWLPTDQETQFQGMEKAYEANGYVLLRTGYEKRYPLYEDLALLITTSGSTGSPKLVRQSYENIFDNAQSIAEYLRLDETERPITTLPMNYVYGLSIINSHFLVGATVLLLPGFVESPSPGHPPNVIPHDSI